MSGETYFRPREAAEGRAIRYSRADLDVWIATSARRSTSDAER